MFELQVCTPCTNQPSFIIHFTGTLPTLISLFLPSISECSKFFHTSSILKEIENLKNQNNVQVMNTRNKSETLISEESHCLSVSYLQWFSGFNLVRPSPIINFKEKVGILIIVSSWGASCQTQGTHHFVWQANWAASNSGAYKNDFKMVKRLKRPPSTWLLFFILQ